MKYLMYMIEKKEKVHCKVHMKKGRETLTDPRTRAVQKALQPADDEIKHEG